MRGSTVHQIIERAEQKQSSSSFSSRKSYVREAKHGTVIIFVITV